MRPTPVRVRDRSPAFRRRRLAVLRENPRCWLCEEAIDLSVPYPDPLAGTVDHVVPYADGGTDDRANLRSAHNVCNRARGRKAEHEVAPLKRSRDW